VARIRWRCFADPQWEIDTHHHGFETWRLAACFANGLTEEGASALSLHDGTLILHLVNGRDLVVESRDALIWQQADRSETTVPDDLSFIRAEVGARELSSMGLDGPFRAMWFGIDEVGRKVRLDVRVEADTRRRAVLVTLVAAENDEASEDAGAAGAFDVPQA
jgi:hypothetical protein